MTDFLLKYLLPCTLAGGLFTLCLFALRPIVKQLKAWFGRVAFIAAIMLFLLPLPLVPALFSGAEATQNSSVISQNMPTDEQPAFALPTAGVYNVGRQLAGALGEESTQVNTAVPAKKVKLADVIFAVWAGGALLAVAVVLVPYVAFMARIRRKSVAQPADSELTNLYNKLCKQLGVRKKPCIWRSKAVTVPLLAGVLRPCIILPAQLEDEEQIEHALRHELAHCRQKDILLKHIVLLARVVHWFNPLVYAVCRGFAAVCERSCDAKATNSYNISQRKAYAETLLNFASSSYLPAVLAFAGSKKQLKERLKKIMKPAKPNKFVRVISVMAVTFTVTVALLAGCGFSSGAASSLAQGQTLSQNIPSSSGIDVPDSSSTPPASSVSSSVPTPQPVSSSQATIGIISEADGPTEVFLSSELSLILPINVDAVTGTRAKDDFHRGTDFYADEGTPIHAAAAGTVAAAEWHWSYGWNVVIDHGNGLFTLYAHCDELFVEEDDEVEQGQEIASVGNTGNSIGSHLHLEMYFGEGASRQVLLDPADYVPMPAPSGMIVPS